MISLVKVKVVKFRVLKMFQQRDETLTIIKSWMFRRADWGHKNLLK